MKFKSFNVTHLKEQFKGDEEILTEMINAFFNVFEDLLKPIRESIEARDVDQLRFNAHAFKGVLSNFYSKEGQKLVQQLEQKNEEDTFETAAEVYSKLENHLVYFLYEMQHFKKSIEFDYSASCEMEEEEEED
jgi:HPt (histidine-containing phosphotransfer) domain-containing protein